MDEFEDIYNKIYDVKKKVHFDENIKNVDVKK
jgi:hypothetical protein